MKKILLIISFLLLNSGFCYASERAEQCIKKRAEQVKAYELRFKIQRLIWVDDKSPENLKAYSEAQEDLIRIKTRSCSEVLGVK